MPTKLSIIIPVYSEEKTITEVINRVVKVSLNNIKKEIIVVDDFSIDKTREILKKIKSSKNLKNFLGHKKSQSDFFVNRNIKIFYHKKNMGKGSAIRTALEHTTGDIILIQDADLEYKPEEYPKLIKPILDKKTKVVYGTRFTKQHQPKYLFYYIGNLFLTFITNLVYNSNIRDMETCYKVFTKDVIKNIKLKARRFDFEPEITAKILKKHHKIYEVPITYKCRDIKEGKKITWRDGLKAIYYLIKYRFVD